MKKLLIPISLVVMSVSGCFGLHFGGGTKATTQNRLDTYNVTLGQQLLDLKKAYEAGAITESEYKAQKKILLRKR